MSIHIPTEKGYGLDLDKCNILLAGSLIAELEDSDNRCYRLEGYLFPDTNEFYRLSKLETVIGKLLANSEAKLKEEYRAKAQELGLSMDELITIASLVEKETSDPKLMPVVASVIYNRLEINMKPSWTAPIFI